MHSSRRPPSAGTVAVALAFYCFVFFFSHVRACSFDMHSGDVTPYSAYIQASFSAPSCRSSPSDSETNTTNASGEIASVKVSAYRGLRVPLLQRDVRVVSYNGVDPREFPGSFVGKVHVMGLQPRRRYYYRFTSPSGKRSPLGSFRTLPRPTDTEASVNIVAISAANQPPFAVADALRNVTLRKDMHMGLFIGDTVFATKEWEPDTPPVPTRQFFNGLYVDQRSTAYGGSDGLAVALRSVPFFNTWDDNEVYSDYVGLDGSPRVNGDRGVSELIDTIPRHLAEALYTFGTRAFFEFNAVTPAAAMTDTWVTNRLKNPKQRMFRRFMVGAHVEVFVLDARQYKDVVQPTTQFIPVLPAGVGTNFTCEGPYANPVLCAVLPGPHGLDAEKFNPLRCCRSVLGGVQRSWLLRSLRTSKAKFKLVVTAAAMIDLIIASSERFPGYPWERRLILNYIEKHAVQNVVFLSAGLFGAMFATLNPNNPKTPIYEFASGPVGSLTAANELGPAFRVFQDFVYKFGGDSHVTRSIEFLALDQPNFLTLRVSNGTLTVRCIGVDGKVLKDAYGNTAFKTLL